MANIALEATNAEVGHVLTSYSPRRIISPEFTDLDMDFTPYLGMAPPDTEYFTKSLFGRVYDTNGDDVVGATVLLFRQSDNYMCATTISGGLGVYVFSRKSDDTQQYYTVAYTLAGGTTQVHGTSDRGMVPV